MAIFGQDRPLFGPREGAAPVQSPTPAGQMAQASGATMSSPFLQYLSANAPAAQQTAQALFGETPEPDFSDAWMQAGMSMMAQPGDRNFLQALGTAGQSAMPMIQAEKQRVQQHEQKVKELAAKLNMSALEFETKMKDRKGLKEMGGYVIDEGQYEDDLRDGADPEEAFMNAALINPSRADEDNAKAFARTKKRLRLMQNDPDADPQEIQVAMDELEYWESKMREDKQSPVQTLTVQDEDGRWTTITGPADQISGTMNAIGDQKELGKIREKFEATDQVMDYGNQIFQIIDNAETKAFGKLGGMASSAAVWSDAIMGNLTGPRKQQYSSEVGENPMSYLDKLSKDPEARAFMGDDTISQLREVGKTNTQLLSNILGLGFATARAQEPGGRLSNADVAFAISSSGYEIDDLLNDPETVKSGVLTLLRRNVADYERTLIGRPNGEELLKNDYFLTKRLPEYGFKWTGGPNGQLIYVGDKADNRTEATSGDQEGPQAPAAQPEPAPQAKPTTKPIGQMTVDELTKMDRTQLSDEELQEAARRYNELTQGAQ